MPATSKAQQRLFGLAYAIKKGDIKKSDADAKAVEIADSMSLADLKKFAETDHKGLPDKVKEGISPSSMGGMGAVAFPSDTAGTADGSGDVPAGRGDAEEEYKKKKKKRDAEIKKQKNESMLHTSFTNFVNEEYEAVGKYNTVKKVLKELGRRPSEKDVAEFIMKNYKDVTGKELKNSDPDSEQKIADIVGFYKFDIDDWEEAMYYAQNESVDEAKDDRSHIILRVAPRNVNNMRDKLQDMHVNHRVEDLKKGIIKVYTDPTSGWYGNEKAQYKLSHDVWVDKFVVKESVNEGKKYEEVEWIAPTKTFDYFGTKMTIKKGEKGLLISYESDEQYLVDFQDMRFYAMDGHQVKKTGNSIKESVDEAKVGDAREELGYVSFMKEMSDLNNRDIQSAYDNALDVLEDKGMAEKEAIGFLNSPHGKYMAEYLIPGQDFGVEAFLDKLDEYYNERMLKKYAKDFKGLA